MLNKIDVKPFDQLSDENKALLTKFQEQENVTFHHTSNVSKEGIMNMRNEACDQLLLQRVESKLRGKKTENILNRLHVAMPEKRDNVVSIALSQVYYNISVQNRLTILFRNDQSSFQKRHVSFVQMPLTDQRLSCSEKKNSSLM